MNGLIWFLAGCVLGGYLGWRFALWAASNILDQVAQEGVFKRRTAVYDVVKRTPYSNLDQEPPKR